MPDHPHFRELTRQEIAVILRRQFVARVAFTFHDRVDIEPVAYVADAGWVYIRTAPGAKLATLAHNRWVAFEVDEVEGMFEWRSVVIHGAVYLLDPDGPEHERAAWEHGVALLRELIPDTFTEEDPVPFRTMLIRIPTSDAVGRMATMRA